MFFVSLPPLSSSVRLWKSTPLQTGGAREMLMDGPKDKSEEAYI